MNLRGESGPLRRFSQKMHWLVSPGASLGSRTLNAGVWAGVLSLSTRLLRLVRTLVLARLLAPADFGLFGIAVIALAVMESLTRTGFSGALVQREGDIDSHLNTAWTTSLVRGFGLGLILFFGAPLVGQFFDSDAAVPLVRALALVPVIGGMTNIGVVYFDKELLFRERFMFRSVPRIAELIVSVGFAIWTRSVWALVLGQIAAEVARVIASYTSHLYRPHFQFVGQRFKELFGFGIWVSANGILTYLMLNLDDIVVGRIMTPEDLGLYQMAFTITTLLAVEINSVINHVTFPAFSKLQSKPLVLRVAYVEVIQLVAFIAIPVAMGMWFVGPVAVEYLLGAKWIGLLPAYGPLLIWGLARSIGGTAGPLFAAIGRPSVNTAVYAASTVALAIVIGPFTTRWGIAGASWATVAAAVAFLLHLVIAARRLTTGWVQPVRALAIPTLSAAAMLAVLQVVALVVPNSDAPLLMLWAPLLGAAVYGLGIVVARRVFDYQPLRFLTEYRRPEARPDPL